MAKEKLNQDFKSKLDINGAGEVLPTQNNVTLLVNAVHDLIIYHNSNIVAPHIEPLKELK